MNSFSLAVRTLIISSLAIILTILGVFTMYSWFNFKNQERVFNERVQLEFNSIQVVINDLYTMGDFIGIRKSLDTFSKLNSWSSGILLDTQGNEIWKFDKRKEDLNIINNIKYSNEIKTNSGGTLARLEITKDHTLEVEKWNQQYYTSILGLLFFGVIALIIQNLFLFRVLKPISELTQELKLEAQKLNIELTHNERYDELILIKKWFFEVANSWKDEKEKAAKESKFRAIATLASQVAHDIRSPLSALSMIIGQLSQIPEDKRILVRSAVNRINDIANSLLEKSKEARSATETSKEKSNIEKKKFSNTADDLKKSEHFISPLLESIVSEKRIQFRDKQLIEIECDVSQGYGVFAKFHAVEIKRVFSNLINNSVESFSENKGKVIVSIKKSIDRVSITIQDNGKGISKQVLERLGEMGVTHGKEGTQSGSGLGVYHAKKTIEACGGTFEIQTKEGQGTSMIMTFDIVPTPNWFVEKLYLASNSVVVSLDDDISIHQIWKGRLESSKSSENKIMLLTFTSGTEFKNWYGQQKQVQNILYLVDYELLNQNQTGLDIIDELGIGKYSIIISSRYEEIKIREQCEKLGVKLIPKAMAGFVPMEIETQKMKYDL